MPAYYCKSLSEFLADPSAIVRDSLTGNSPFFHHLKSQIDSWSSLIEILKDVLLDIPQNENWGILLEYPIPRRSKRIDAVIIADNLIIVIEFKDGKTEYLRADVCQLEDYCLDLRDFHYQSQERIVVPILLSTSASSFENNIQDTKDYVKQTLFANRKNLNATIKQAYDRWAKSARTIDFIAWDQSKYSPTPTIIEAAQALYAGQDVKEISRSHAGVENLASTTNAILNAINDAKLSNSKIICFITGVPGAGKTLAGLNIVHSKQFKDNGDELGVFLSGNSPLVKVLSEALARDSSRRTGITRSESRRKVSTFVHNVHQFIDAYYDDDSKIPVDKVLIYDEAQRAWTKEYKFRKSEGKINASEPEILLSIMNRFASSWSVIIALVGTGQEINTGEGGLAEWGKSLSDKFSDWKVYVSPQLKMGSSSNGDQFLFDSNTTNVQIIENSDLHLNTTIRSYKAEKLSQWVSLVLSNDVENAKAIYDNDLKQFPLFITRSLDDAKRFLKSKSRGSRRCGLVASSGGRRLRSIGLDINAGLKGISTQEELGCWYLNPAEDVRSSNFLEIVSSEFGIQGLELDWIGLCWDIDLRRNGPEWNFKQFKGTSWSDVHNKDMRRFILNKYRVLLTRAREGMIIYVPYGSNDDYTREPHLYDDIFEYLCSCGVMSLNA